MGLTRPRAHQLQDIDYKQTARAVTVANVTLSGGAPATVDGTSLALRDRVLVTAQTTGSENGIYYVTTVGAGSNGTWARSLDADATGEIKAGTIIMITEGTTYADTQWKLTTDDPITVGSTTMTFVRAGNAAYGTFAVSGQNSIVADQIGDTLTMVAGTNLTLTTNDGTDTLTITPSLTPSLTSVTATGTGQFGTMTDGTVSFTSGNISGVDELRIGQNGTGLRMTNVGAFDNDGSDNFRLFSTNNLIFSANGDSNTALTIDTTNQDVTVANDLRVDDGNLYLGGVAVSSTAAELNLLDGVTGITLGNAGETVLVGTDGTSLASTTLLAYDTGNNRVGIGTTTPAVKLHIAGNGVNEGQIRLQQANNTSGDGPDFAFYASRGTIASPAATQDNDVQGRINAYVYTGSAYVQSGSFGWSSDGTDGDNDFTLSTRVATSLGVRLGITNTGAVQLNSAYTFPTADGSANQVLQTDGSGTLTFAAATGGISAVVDDTSPQLGGDLDLNSSDITGTGDINNTGTITATGNITGGNLVTTGTVTMDRLSLSSTQTSVPPLQLTANSLSDNVGALRIDGSEPDIYLNQNGVSFTTVTFARQIGVNAQPMVGFGKNSSDNLYFFRETAQDVANTTTYDNTSFVMERSSGNISFGHNLTVTGITQAGTLTDGTATITAGAITGATSITATGNVTANNFVGNVTGTAGSVSADDISAGDAAVNITTTSGSITLDAQGNNTDIIFKGTASGADITALTLDMSATGTARFNNGVEGRYFWGSKPADNGATLYAGVNFEILLTHVHNTGFVLTNSGTGTPAVELQFVDANEAIGSDGTNLLLTSGGSEITVPASAGNMVVDSATQTLTNKTLTSPTINAFTGTGNGSITGTLSIVTTTTDDSLLITTTEDSSSAAPVLTLKRNSSSVADADYLGQLKFKGENDADQEVVYAKITGKIQDASDGSEDGLLEFANRKAGSNNINMRLRSDSLQLLNGTNLQIRDQQDARFYDSDSSNYIGFKAPSTVTSDVDYILPADGSNGQVLSTNGSGTLSFVDNSGGGSGNSFPNCTVTPLPGSEGDFDLAKQFDQTGSAETPFESGATDAFGVSLGQIYTMMDPVGSTLSPTDLGVLS